jgi:prepilin-type N-terminal cleavage/methylation domain-containing protein
MKKSGSDGGFTLVELIVSVSIFVFMTAFLVVRYGTFNQGVIVTNAAYDIALAVRSAQSYGLNVMQSVDVVNPFKHGFGAHFSPGAVFYTFSDVNDDGVQDTGEILSTSNLKKGIAIASIQAVCSDLGPTTQNATVADVTFKRPDPDAIIKATIGGTPHVCQFVQINISAPDGSKKAIVVRGTGQIAIQ